MMDGCVLCDDGGCAGDDYGPDCTFALIRLGARCCITAEISRVCGVLNAWLNSAGRRMREYAMVDGPLPSLYERF